MKNVELYAKVRHAHRNHGLSERAAARRFGIDARTVKQDDEVFGAAAVPHFYDHQWCSGRPTMRRMVPAVIRISALISELGNSSSCRLRLGTARRQIG